MRLSRRALILAGLLALPLSVQAQDRLKVVTTFTVIADMARNVAGEGVDVVSVTKPGAEIHGYEPTPKDIVAASDADLILWNGLDRIDLLQLRNRNLNINWIILAARKQF